jgi:hypothetical protein
MEYYSTPAGVILRSPIEVSPGDLNCLWPLFDSTAKKPFFDCGKCDRMDKLWAAVLSGRGALSLNIAAFRASQMPQLMMRGRDLSSLNLRSWIQASKHVPKRVLPMYSSVRD